MAIVFSDTLLIALKNRVLLLIDMYTECVERPYTTFYDTKTGFSLILIINDLEYMDTVFSKIRIKLDIKDVFYFYFNLERRIKLVKKYEELGEIKKKSIYYCFPYDFLLNKYTYKLPMFISYLIVCETQEKHSKKKYPDRYYKLLRSQLKGVDVIDKYFKQR
jgi:hypothetical protein